MILKGAVTLASSISAATLAPETKHNLADHIPSAFPIESQTSEADKLALLITRDLLGRSGSYSYAEIGSFMGGSLAPFLLDAKCEAVLSIDDRGRHQPDARGRTFDYTQITHQTMLDNLTGHGLPITKIETFDGSISEYDVKTRLYDALFIDGEHTDWACFRDFIHGEKLLKPNAVVMFHDTALVLTSLQIIKEYLVATSRKFTFFKMKNSEVSFIVLGDLCDSGFADQFIHEPDFDAYARKASRKILRQVIQNMKR